MKADYENLQSVNVTQRKPVYNLIMNQVILIHQCWFNRNGPLIRWSQVVQCGGSTPRGNLCSPSPVRGFWVCSVTALKITLRTSSWKSKMSFSPRKCCPTDPRLHGTVPTSSWLTSSSDEKLKTAYWYSFYWYIHVFRIPVFFSIWHVHSIKTDQCTHS